MEKISYRTYPDKVILRTGDRLCENADELLSSKLANRIISQAVHKLVKRNSPMLRVFDRHLVADKDITRLIEFMKLVLKIPPEMVIKVMPEAEQFLRDRQLLNDFIEYLYNYWRSLQRFIICDSAGNSFDRRPYQTFNNTVESLTHLVRGTYRDLQESITGTHPRIYRQVRAAAEVAAIALPKDIPYPTGLYRKLNDIAVIRQILIYPPLIFNPPMNKRSGVFERVDKNPLEGLQLSSKDWLCYPAKVGPLLIMIYFSLKFAELGFSLCNLFELADEKDLQGRPDAAYLFGVPEKDFPALGKGQTIFFDDEKNDMLIAAVPESDVFGYFGYLKKMTLTLHNIVMMKRGRLPFHGAMVTLRIHEREPITVLIVGDTGAGKSESLEAFRIIGKDEIEEITIIADDMGSLTGAQNGHILGYGTETGAFIRLDDLQTGYAFGQIDRTIIMSPDQTNARVILPVTTYQVITRGVPVDLVLYANNYEAVDSEHPTLEWFQEPESALEVFRGGKVMSKGTTTLTGMNQTYFANVFGPEQYQELHETLAKEFFDAFFRQGIRVGQLRTQLGIAGMEMKGPEHAARSLLDFTREGKKEIS